MKNSIFSGIVWWLCSVLYFLEQNFSSSLALTLWILLWIVWKCTCIGQGSLTFSILSIFYRAQEPSCDTAENNVQPVVSPEEAELCSKMVFPELKESDISCYINKQENMLSEYTVKRVGPCVVPSNPMSSRQQHYIPSRKLEVLRDCVDYIFENKISEARKVNITIYFSYCYLQQAVWHCCDSQLGIVLHYRARLFESRLTLTQG